ncbi:MAG TPA: hypothetical protein VGI03_13580 [Verrucomicrobiae bacterium]|jgi:hypothetical protein
MKFGNFIFERRFPVSAAPIFKLVAPLCLGVALVVSGCAKKKFASWESFKNPEAASQLKSFVAQKEAQVNAAFQTNGQTMPPKFERYFATAANDDGVGVSNEFERYFASTASGDWVDVSNEFAVVRQFKYKPSSKDDLRLQGPIWQPVVEVWNTFNCLAEGNEKYSTLFAHEIIGSIPSGSIYFGGTGPGRSLITGMEKSQVNADPFFLLTQNALTDDSYLDYLRSMYGNQIYIPTAGDAEKCFREYTADAKQRFQNHQLNPGEDVQVDPQSGRVQISGYITVIEIRALLAKIIFDQNSNREFYVEESFPLNWMYPYLEPHGLVLKLTRQPLPELPNAVLKQDHDYWSKLVQPMIGSWLNDDTPLKEVADFDRKIFLQHDLTGFTGDLQFVQNDFSCQMFSQERSSIADLYVWRAENAVSPAEKQRMNGAADYAFRQAWALSPYSPETTIRYINFLGSENRMADALLVAETTASLRSNGQMDALVRDLKQKHVNFAPASAAH